MSEHRLVSATKKMNTVAVLRSQKRNIIAISGRKTLMIQGALKIVSKKNKNLVI